MQLETSRLRRHRPLLTGLALAYPVLLIGLVLLHGALPQRSGLTALSQVFAPYLFLPLLLLLPLALRRGTWVLRAALVVCLLVGAWRYLPWHPPAPASVEPT